MFNVTGVAGSDVSAKNYPITLSIPLVPLSFVAFFCSLFWFSDLQLYYFGSMFKTSSAPNSRQS